MKKAILAILLACVMLAGAFAGNAVPVEDSVTVTTRIDPGSGVNDTTDSSVDYNGLYLKLYYQGGEGTKTLFVDSASADELTGAKIDKDQTGFTTLSVIVDAAAFVEADQSLLVNVYSSGYFRKDGTSTNDNEFLAISEPGLSGLQVSGAVISSEEYSGTGAGESGKTVKVTAVPNPTPAQFAEIASFDFSWAGNTDLNAGSYSATFYVKVTSAE